jgi:hypothetical protein
VSVESAVEAGRRLLATTFLDTCRIERRTLGSDGAGGHTNAYAPIASGLPCRFGVPIDPQPYRQQDEVYGPPTASVLLTIGTDVLEGDHIVNEASNDVWLVVGNKTPASNLAVSVRVNVREV